MKPIRLQRRTLGLVAVIAPLLALFIYVALRSGPLAPIPVTVATVESRPISPALFGIGTVQARYSYKIGPTFAGRIKRLDVDVGDRVIPGQVLGEMDPVDLDNRIGAQQAAIRSAEAALQQAESKHSFALAQAKRYALLFDVRGTTEEAFATRQQELAVAEAALGGAREDVARLRADLEALRAQRNNLRLTAPAAGLVVARAADPGTTVVAGQAVIEVVDPAALWVDAHFDQNGTQGLATGQAAGIVLRSRQGQILRGHVLRVEPLADAVTEEMLAKIRFDTQASPLPPIGELAEVTIRLPQLASAPAIPNAAIRTIDGRRGVWKLTDGKPEFTPVVLGQSDLDGRTQVKNGLAEGDRIIAYSEKTLTANSRIHVVDRIPGAVR